MFDEVVTRRDDSDQESKSRSDKPLRAKSRQSAITCNFVAGDEGERMRDVILALGRNGAGG